MKRILPLCAALLLLFCGGCTNVPAQTGTDISGQVSDPAPDVMPFSADTEIVFGTPEGMTDLISLTVDEAGNLYAASFGGIVGKYAPDGTLLQDYPGTERFCALRYADGYLYGVDSNTKEIVRCSADTGETEVLHDGIRAFQISSFEILDGDIYIVAMTSYLSQESEVGADRYANYGEKLLIYEIEDNVLRESTCVANPISLYRSSTGKLFIYAHPDVHYELYEYDAAKDRAAKTAEMDDTGYLSAFVYEGEHFVCFSIGGSIQAKNMRTGLVYQVCEGFPASFSGNCFTYDRGNVLFLLPTEEQGTDELHSELRTLCLSGDVVTLRSEEEDPVQDRGFLTISNSIDRVCLKDLVDTGEVYRRSGIRAVTTDNDLTNESAYRTALLAGDTTSDIYIMKAVYNDLENYLTNVGYVPLNASARIDGFLDGCFDWVRDAVTLENGDIAMFPIWFDLPGVWCSEQLFEQFDLTPKDFSDLDSLLAANERMLEEKGDYMVHINFDDLYWNLLLQYESLYCDYSGGTADFKTEEFMNLFEKLFAGWHMDSQYHPMIQHDKELVFTDETALHDLRQRGYHKAVFQYYPELTVYALEKSRMFMNIDRMLETSWKQIADPPMPPIDDSWRVLPPPRISDEIERNICTEAVYLVINPRSEHIDLAIAYLEAIAEDIQACTCLNLFIQKDISAYEGYFDMTKPVYQDIYRIFENAATYSMRLNPGELKEPIREYQDGVITLNEAVAEIDRRAKFFAGE